MDLRQLAMDSGILDRSSGSNTVEIEVMGKKLAMDSAELIHTLQETNLSGMRGEGFGMCLTGNRKRDHEVLILDSSSRSNQFKRNAEAMMMDDDYAYNIGSSGVPNVLTAVWTTRFFKQIYQSTPFRELTTADQQGTFGTTNVKYPLIQGSGVSKLYADHSGLGDSSINLNYLTQQTVTLQRTLTYGDMQTAVMGMAKVDYVAWLREYVATLITLDQNNIGFNGFAGMQCYGLLNNPGLNPVLVAGSGQWITSGTYASVVSDIITTVQSIQTLGAGQVDTDDEFIIGLPPCVFGALLYQNSFGMSVKAYIEGVYPKCKFIQVQNYTGTGTPLGSVAPNYMQVIFKQIAGQDTALGVFSSLYNSHGVVRLLSSYNEKVSYVLGGTVLPMPIGVATLSGI
jgi:hypothetical protein